MANYDVMLFAFPFSITPDKGSGVERYTYDLLNNLADKGFKIKIISKPTDNKFRKYTTIFSEIPFNTLMTRTKLYHAVSPYSSKFLFLSHRHPVLTSIHDVIYLDWEPDAPDFFERRRAKYNIMALNKSDKIIVPFNYTKDRIQTVFGLDDNRIRVIKYGINLSRFLNTQKSRLTNSFRYDVLFIGGVNPISRGGRTVLETYKVLLGINSKLRLAVSGMGPQMEKIIAIAQELELTKRIRWIGFIPEEELPIVLKDSAIFFYPSYMGFSYLMMQAMASSVPVVTSNVFDTPEFVGNAAPMFEPRDIDGYAGCLIELLNSQNLRTELITKGKRLLSTYNPRTMASDTAKVYREYE